MLRSGAVSSFGAFAPDFPDPNEPSKTVQSEKENSDINVIVRRFGIGQPMPLAAKLPQFGDFEGITDFQTALNAVMNAKANFMELPADIRARFQNSPQELLKFCGDPNNAEEAIKLGLAKRREGADNVGNVPAVPVVSENGDGKVSVGEGIGKGASASASAGGSAPSGK